MELSKWYIDVATPDGRCAIVYAARLRLLGLSLRVHGLVVRSGGRVRERWSLLPSRAPRVEGARLRHASRSLGLSVSLAAIDPPHARRLVDLPSGTLDWECRFPRAEAVVRVGRETLRGLGYAERVRLRLPPWELPLRELRWGRLLSAAGGLTWIEWRGPGPLRLALRDGRPAVLDSVDDRGVTVDGIHHPLERVATLRDAPLSRTLPPPLRRSLPQVGLRVRETKWLARGEVGGAAALAIHEVVRWPG